MFNKFLLTQILAILLVNKFYFNYTVNTPGRRKQKQLCHINMLKKYIDRDISVISSVNLVNTVPPEHNQWTLKI